MFIPLQVLTIIVVAIAFALSLAHALELPGKMRLDKETYYAVQPIYYPGFTIGGVSEPAGILLRDLEIQLALSALPTHLRENATVYVLNSSRGFEVARNGTNGFHALVARTGDDAFRGSWPLTEYRDDILYPISFDKAGAAAPMRVFFDAAEMQAKGTPPEELKRIIKDRYKTGYYKVPERAGISYMLSPILRTYWNPEESDKVTTISHPHVMYYAPNVSNEDIGGEKPGGMYPHLIMPGPHGFIVQPLGVTEKEAINKEYGEMLQRLCKIQEVWCLP